MATIGNNQNPDASYMRDSFFDSEEEKEFFKELLKDPKERKIHERLEEKDAQKLFKKAKEIHANVEQGLYNEEEMEEAEYLLAHLLAAIKDLELVLELER